VLERLHRIDCPTLILAAENDYTPVAEKRAAVERLPNARLKVIPDSRHATPIDAAETFNEVVLSFLDEASD